MTEPKIAIGDIHYTTKGLHIILLDASRYVVQDAFGNSCLPIAYKSQEDVIITLKEIFNLTPLVSIQEQHELPTYESFNWRTLEHWCVAHLDYALNDFVVRENKEEFFQKIYCISIAYLEFGYGDGSRTALEDVDKTFRKLIADGKMPISLIELEIWMVLQQLKRIFKEIMSVLQRAIVSFMDLLALQRDCIRSAAYSLPHLRSNEVIHRGKNSYRASTAATTAVISLCTSLDLQSKLIHYLDQINFEKITFKPPGGRHFSDLRKIKPRQIPENLHKNILEEVDSNSSVSELVQFRHDIVHSTSALELEKIYVGYDTPEIHKNQLYYSFQGWRDCGLTGQPDRYLGRDYFTGNHNDIELRILNWIRDIINIHIKSAERINQFIKN